MLLVSEKTTGKADTLLVGISSCLTQESGDWDRSWNPSCRPPYQVHWTLPEFWLQSFPRISFEEPECVISYDVRLSKSLVCEIRSIWPFGLLS